MIPISEIVLEWGYNCTVVVSVHLPIFSCCPPQQSIALMHPSYGRRSYQHFHYPA